MLHHHLLDWPFPDKYSPTKGRSVRRFKFHFKDLTNPLKNLLEPSQDLINTESGEEETTTVPTLLTTLIQTTKELTIKQKVIKMHESLIILTKVIFYMIKVNK